MTIQQKVLKLLSGTMAFFGIMLILCAVLIGLIEIAFFLPDGITSGFLEMKGTFDPDDDQQLVFLSLSLGVVLFAVVGILSIVATVLGFKVANDPSKNKAFVITCSIVLAATLIGFACFLTSFETSEMHIALLLTFAISLFADVFALMCAVKCKRLYDAGVITTEQLRQAKEDAWEHGLGFMAIFQAIFALNIVFMLVMTALVGAGSINFDLSSIMAYVNVIFDGISFWLIWKRSRAARYWVIGFSTLNILVAIGLGIATPDSSIGDVISNCWLDLILVPCFLFAKRPRRVLTEPFSLTLTREEKLDAWDIYKPRTWEFWRSMIIYFCLFSIIGHWMEAGFCLLIKYGIVPGIYDPNSGIWRDYLNPFPVYGFGVLACAIILYPIKNALCDKCKGVVLPLILSFVINSLICAAIELILGFMSNMPDANGVYPLWDYSTMPFNFMGQICLQNTLLFGIVATLVTWAIFPILQRAYMSLTKSMQQVLFVGVAVFYAVILCLYVVNINLPHRIEYES